MKTIISISSLSEVLNKIDLAATASSTANQNVSISFKKDFLEIFFITGDLMASITASSSNTEGDDVYVSLPLSVLKSIQRICSKEDADSVLIDVSTSSLTYQPLRNSEVVQNKTVVSLYWPFSEDEYNLNKQKLEKQPSKLQLVYDSALQKYATAFSQVISMMPLQDDNLGFFVKDNKVYFTDNRHMYYDAVLEKTYVEGNHVFIPARLFKLLSGLIKLYGQASFYCDDESWAIREDNFIIIANYKTVELLYPTDEEKAANGPDKLSANTGSFTLSAKTLSDITSNFEAHDRLYALGEVLKPVSVASKSGSVEFDWSSDNESVKIVKEAETSGTSVSFCLSTVLLDAVLATVPEDSMITIASQNGSLSEDHCSTFELTTNNMDAIIVKLVK